MVQVAQDTASKTKLSRNSHLTKQEFSQWPIQVRRQTAANFSLRIKKRRGLPEKHTIFGYVITGQDVVNTIAQDDVIQKVTIIRKGAAAKAYDAAKNLFRLHDECKAE